MSDMIRNVKPIITGRPLTGQSIQKPTTAPSFGSLLQEQIRKQQTTEVSFSKHAQARQAQRGIELSGEDMEKLSSAVDRAEEKGVTDTLVFMNNTAFIVNVPSKVVVTLMDGSETDQNVFTNIDGAVIV